MTIHEEYMKRAIELAKTAEGFTSPNPMVGCVVVKDGKIISEACHERCGQFHAERNALLRCKEDTNGAELYVTLEPCCHYGKTPPCTEIIVEKGIKKVYVGSMDSNPLVAGKGLKYLEEHGIEVETGILERECLKMNEVFYHYIVNKTPYVIMKYAMTLDGKISAFTGDSKWITGELARTHVHQLRKKYSGIMVGINTVLTDNPTLNIRLEDRDYSEINPTRIILDSSLRIPMDSNIVRTSENIPTVVAYCNESSENFSEKARQLEEKKVTLLRTKSDSEGHIDLTDLMKKLGTMNIDSVLVEGGGEVNASLLKENLVNKVYAYIGSKIITGRTAKTPVAGPGIELMKDAVSLKDVSLKQFEDGDILVTGYIK